MHAIAYSLLGEDRNRWGKQRYFGTMGFLTGALIVGLAMQLTSEGENTNVTANFIAYFSLCIISSILVYFYQIPGDVQCGSLLKNLKVLVKNPALDALFVLVFCLGTVMGACETFLLLYIKDLGGPELLLGLSLFVNCNGNPSFVLCKHLSSKTWLRKLSLFELCGICIAFPGLWSYSQSMVGIVD